MFLGLKILCRIYQAVRNRRRGRRQQQEDNLSVNFFNSRLNPFKRTFPGGFDDDRADLCALPPPQSSPQPSRALHPPGVFLSSTEKHKLELYSCRRSRSAGARCLAASQSGSSYLASSRTCSSSSTPRPTFSSTAFSVLGSGWR